MYIRFLRLMFAQMLYFDRIDVSEGTDAGKTNTSKECSICHYWHFLGKWFKFQPDAMTS